MEERGPPTSQKDAESTRSLATQSVPPFLHQHERPSSSFAGNFESLRNSQECAQGLTTLAQVTTVTPQSQSGATTA